MQSNCEDICEGVIDLEEKRLNELRELEELSKNKRTLVSLIELL